MRACRLAAPGMSESDTERMLLSSVFFRSLLLSAVRSRSCRFGQVSVQRQRLPQPGLPEKAKRLPITL